MPLTPEQKRERRKLAGDAGRAANAKRMREARAAAKLRELEAERAVRERIAREWAEARDELYGSLMAAAEPLSEYDPTDDDLEAMGATFKQSWSAFLRHCRQGLQRPDTCASCEQPIWADQDRTALQSGYPVHCLCPDN